MENMTLLLEKLANKLGTTAELLWGILIAQAPISATIDLITHLLCAIAAYYMIRIPCKNLQDESEYPEGNITVLGVGILFGVIVLICFTHDLPLIVAGWFNPEYWALHEVAQTMRSCK